MPRKPGGQALNGLNLWSLDGPLGSSINGARSLRAHFFVFSGNSVPVMTALAHIFYGRGRMLRFRFIIDLVGMLKFCSIHMNYGSLRFLWWPVRVAHRLHLFLPLTLLTECLYLMYFYELSTEASDTISGSPRNC